MEWARLTWRMQRWELAFLIGSCLALAAALALVGRQIGVSREAYIACYAENGGVLSDECRATVEWGNLLAGTVGILGAAATVAPFAVGIFLGAPLVAREIEHRTAPIAWTLSRSRRRWLAGRTLPLLVVIGLALLAVGQASELLHSSIEEGELGFRHYGMVGPLIAARGLAMFASGVAVGLAVGRVLPAILLTVLAAVALTGGLALGRDLIMSAEAVWVPMGEQAGVVDKVFDSGFRSDETGEVITWEQAYNEYPDAFNEFGEGAPPGMTPVWRIVPPDRYPLYVAREMGALGLVVVAMGAVATVVVSARRPE